jgi:6-phosphogluconolactonase (cycloisomerase 2 family)
MLPPKSFRRKIIFVFFLSFLIVPALNAGQVARFAYVANPYDYTISSFYLDENGVMYPNGMVFTKDKFPATLIIHPNNRFIYSASRTVDTAPIFEIDSVTGRLTESPYSRFNTKLRSPFSYGFHPNGKFLYVAGRGGGVGGFIIDEKTGAMSHIAGSPFKSGERTRCLTVHPSGKFVYASNAYTNNISAYRVDEKTGVLTQLKSSPFPAGEAGPFDDTFAKLPDVMENKGGLPYYIASHPSGDFVYVTNWAAASVSVFRVNQETGDLSLIGLPVQTGLTPYAVAVHPSGKFVYASTWGGNDIWVYRVNRETGMLDPIEGTPFETLGMKPVDITFDEDGSLLFVANNGSNSVTVFKSNNETGALEIVDFAMTRAGAVDVEILTADKTVSIVPKFAFVLDKEKSQLISFRVDEKKGGLEKLATAKTGKLPSALAIDPLNRFVFVANYGDDTVSAFSVDQSSGSLNEVEGSPYKAGKKPRDLMVDANGWYLYTANEESKDMSAFLIHYKKGQLAEAQGSPLAFNAQPKGISGDQTSRFVYVSSDENKSVRVLRFRTAVTPSIFEITDHGSPFVYNSTPSAVVNDPTGRFTLVTQKESSLVAMFFVQVATGELLPIPGNEEPYKLDGKEPVDAVFHPSGKFAYVLNKASKSISQIRVGRKIGKMTKIADALRTESIPLSMAVDPSGKFLYVINEGRKGLQRFSIDSESGKLAEIEKIPLGYMPEDIVISRDFK